MNPGTLYATLAFAIWGLFPLYFQFIASVPPLEVVLHRSTWALLVVLGLLAWKGHWAWLGETLRQPRRLALFAASATLLSYNWLVYVLAVQTGHVVDASLGYFINPLVNVLLGVLVLRERLRRPQWVAVALAACGVAWLTWQAGQLPWIALTLAVSFGLYGLIRKTASLGALEDLALENLLLAPVVLPLLAWWTLHHDGALAQGDLPKIGWLLPSGRGRRMSARQLNPSAVNFLMLNRTQNSPIASSCAPLMEPSSVIGSIGGAPPSRSRERDSPSQMLS
jgi:chloramphenicol-sensitive protein RarD